MRVCLFLRLSALKTKPYVLSLQWRRVHHVLLFVVIVGRDIADVPQMLSNETAKPSVVGTQRGRVDLFELISRLWFR